MLLNNWKENFLHIFNTIGDGSLIIDVNTKKIKYINDRCLELFGYKEKELIDVNFNVLVPEERRSVHEIYIKETHSDTVYSNKIMGKNRIISGLHKSGSKIIIKIKLNTIYINKKKHILIQIKNKEKKQGLIDKLNQYKSMFDKNLDMTCIASVDGYFVEVNDAFEKTLGYAKEELYNKPFLDYIYKDDVQPTVIQLKKLSNGESVIQFKNRYYCKNGTIKWISWSAIPKSEYLLYAIGRDITKEENKLNIMIDIDSDHREIEVLANIGSWKWVIGTDKIEWSEGLKRIFNLYSPTYESYMNIIHDEDRGKLSDIIETCIKTKLSYEVYHRIKYKKEIKYIYGRGKYIVNEQGDDYLIGVAQDITEQTLANNVLSKYEYIGIKH